MMRRMMMFLSLCCLGFYLGCRESTTESSPQTLTASIMEKYWMPTPPARAQSTIEVKNTAKNGDAVVLVGRVKDLTDGFAQFTVADQSLKACSDREGDSCPTPWDYCCVDQNEITAGTVTVEIRDGNDPMKQGFKGFHGLDHLKTVTVKGIVEKSGDNVIIVASGLNVQ